MSAPLAAQDIGPPAQTRELPLPLSVDVEHTRRVMEDAARQELMVTQERDLREPWAAQPTESADLVFPPPILPSPALPASAAPRLRYPELLAEFVGEPFFMAYGNLHFRHQLTPRHEERIRDYRLRRDRLVEAIRTKLNQLQDAPWPQRRQALADLAAQQASDLRQVETEAEAIRTELTAMDDGAALAKRLATLRPGDGAALREFVSLLLAAQYHAGLSLEQRQLLVEIANDSLLEPSRVSPRFLPAGSVIPWPDSPPAEAAGLLARFHAQRSALRAELRTRIMEIPENSSPSRRTKILTALAEQLAPRFGKLDDLAEEIRREFADRPWPGQPAPSAHPPELMLQVTQALEHNAQLKRSTTRLLREFSEILAPERVKLVAPAKVPQLEVQPAADAKTVPLEARAAAVTRLQAANAQLRRDYTDLAAEMETARAKVQQYRESLHVEPLPTVSQLTAQLARAQGLQENWERFEDYRRAVAAPGLSPAQRRLLLNAAFVTLEKRRLAEME
ncbi:MAG TPA: hypothetical protein VG734_04030 [Lacunisphaera sp.]|nr:hypothetical protein [Lacunisphaera sp.]